MVVKIWTPHLLCYFIKEMGAQPKLHRGELLNCPLELSHDVTI